MVLGILIINRVLILANLVSFCNLDLNWVCVFRNGYFLSSIKDHYQKPLTVNAFNFSLN